MLGVLEAEERAVLGERAPEEAAAVDAAEPDGLMGPVDLGRRAAVE